MNTVSIGDTSRNGLYQITDTAWDSNGAMRVTVREMVGERGVTKPELEAMRRFAKRALPEHHEGQTQSARTVVTWYAQGCTHATFLVTRNER